MTNDEARAVFARADIVADQFLLGAYALFAIEAMALGKPVLCYLNDRFRPLHPEWDECPIVNADPDTLTDELRNLALDPARRASWARAARGTSARYHSLEAVGARKRHPQEDLRRAELSSGWYPARSRALAARLAPSGPRTPVTNNSVSVSARKWPRSLISNVVKLGSSNAPSGKGAAQIRSARTTRSGSMAPGRSAGPLDT